MDLAIDLDGVVYPFTETFAMHIHYHTRKPLEEMTAPLAWEFWEQWGLSKDEWLAHFTRYGITGGFLHGRPMDGAVETLHALKMQGHAIHILTARGCHWASSLEFRRAVKQDTIAFLEKHAIHYDSLLFSAHKEIINADIFLDDCQAHLEDIARAGKRAVCFDHLHNRGFKGERVQGWHEFYDLVEQRGPYLIHRLGLAPSPRRGAAHHCDFTRGDL